LTITVEACALITEDDPKGIICNVPSGSIDIRQVLLYAGEIQFHDEPLEMTSHLMMF